MVLGYQAGCGVGLDFHEKYYAAMQPRNQVSECPWWLITYWYVLYAGLDLVWSGQCSFYGDALHHKVVPHLGPRRPVVPLPASTLVEQVVVGVLEVIGAHKPCTARVHQLPGMSTKHLRFL